MNVLDHIGNTGLIPVVVIDSADDAAPAAKALLDAGVDVMEITMRTAAGIRAIENVKASYPEMLVGAGTVLTVEKAEEAVKAGAEFIVAPGFNPNVVKWCIDHEITITPGCVTPTEIEHALSYGLKILKFFPANVFGGVKGCNSLYGPYKSEGIKFIPTGGINNENLKDYAGKPFIHAVGGSWFCKTEDIAGHNFDGITAAARSAVEIFFCRDLSKVQK